MVDKFGEGRVFVAGGERYCSVSIPSYADLSKDAAHVHTPAGGQVCVSVYIHNNVLNTVLTSQGLNSGAQDSVCLAVITSQSPPDSMFLVQHCVEDRTRGEGPRHAFPSFDL